MARVRKTRKQTGFALLLAVFFTALLLLVTITAAPAIRNQRQREKEAEMIWRGKQYVHAIKLYYRKNGRFPTSLEDLTKPKTGSLRYLRQAYKDPMNKEDGTWRLIYVGPSGQLIGSLKPPQTLQMPGGGQVGTPAAQAGLGSGAPQGAAAAAQPGQGITGSQAGDTTPGTPGGPQDANAAGGNNPSSLGLSPMSGSDSPTIIGGNIIGVGSRISKKSIIVYEKAQNYRLFEFVWDPSKDVMAVGGQPGMQVGTPNGPGQGLGTGFGQPPGAFGTQPSTQPSNNPPPNQPSIPPLTPNSPMP